MLFIDPRSRVPFYKQLQEQIIMLIRLGALQTHMQLPSIREVAADANLNFNTVKKAFSELETLGVIYTVPGKGCFVDEHAPDNARLKQNTLQELANSLRSAVVSGVSRDEILELLESVTKQLEGSV